MPGQVAKSAVSAHVAPVSREEPHPSIETVETHWCILCTNAERFVQAGQATTYGSFGDWLHNTGGAGVKSAQTSRCFHAPQPRLSNEHPTTNAFACAKFHPASPVLDVGP